MGIEGTAVRSMRWQGRKRVAISKMQKGYAVPEYLTSDQVKTVLVV